MKGKHQKTKIDKCIVIFLKEKLPIKHGSNNNDYLPKLRAS